MTDLNENERLREAWESWSSTRSSDARAVLLEAYLPLVRYQASRIVTGLPQHVSMDDLVQAGTFGLMDALDRYEVGRVKFETFSLHRIKGAIIDYLREQDWAPRSLRKKVRAVETATSLFEAKHGRPPTEEETATAVGITRGELSVLMARAAQSHFVPLENTVGSDQDGDTTMPSERDVPAAVSVTLDLEVREIAATVARAIPRLQDGDRMVLAMYYVEELSLADISEALGVVESRASQLHTRAVTNLQKVMVGVA